MTIGVMGAGGVGGYFGARLAAAGNDVTFIARGAHLQALRTSGLCVNSKLGDIALPSVKVTSDPREAGTVDVVIFALQLWDTNSGAEAILPMLGPATTIVSLQNGVRKGDILRAIVGDEALIGGVCYVAASIVRPGTIGHVGNMQKLVFGEFDGSRSKRIESFYAACVGAGLEAHISDDISRTIWEKYVFLVGLSACTAAARQPIGVVRTNASTRGLLLESMREVVAVARAHGIALDPDYADKQLHFVDALPADVRASMAVDLERGNRLELPWLSGDVVQLGLQFGLQYGIATPVNRVLTAVLSPYVEGAPTPGIAGA